MAKLLPPVSLLKEKNPAPVAFSPTDISGLKLWLKADALGLSDNDPISSFTDFSGTANHATATLTERPTFKTSIINGLPVARFDGSNDNLVFTSVAGANSTFVVGKINVAPASLSAYAVFIIYSTADSGRLCARISTTNWGTFLSSAADLSAGELLVSGTPVLLEMTSSSGGGTKLYRNGSLLASNASSSSNGTTAAIGAEIGDTRFLNGDIAEIVVYDTVLSAPNRVLVENFLMDKYAL